MSKKIKRICSTETVYPLFLYFLICGYNEEDIFIFSEGFPKSIRNNLNHICFPKIQFYSGYKFAPLNSIDGIIKNIKGYFKYLFGILKLRFLLFIKTFNYEVEIYGHAQTPFSFPFYEFEKSYLLEDGLGNYYDLKETPKKNFILEKVLHFLGVYIYSAKEGYGTHKNIKKVYLTKDMAPDIVKNKVEIVDLKKMWNEKSNEEKNKILNVFNLKNDFFNDKKINKTILLTEPFSEDGHLTFEEELNIYKNIIKKYKSEEILIKTHPREIKDYRKIFPNIEVIDTPFPVELLSIIGLKIDKIVTICSSAVLNFNDCQIEFYDGEISSKDIIKATEFLKNKLKNS